ncbi:MAG: glycolate oxidase subunit GlcF [bacterium]
METRITPEFLATGEGRKADAILRRCVHCGFCTATCPTYQLLGDELDGPRGRIYLIKGLLEGQAATNEVQQHLDRCLTCRACESTCPSGVQYSQLIHIGRQITARADLRPPVQKILRWGLRNTLAYPRRLKPLVNLARTVRPLLPASLKQQLPEKLEAQHRPTRRHTRQVVLFDGCVQSVMAQQINNAAARLLDRLEISVSDGNEANCCGAVNHHLDDKRSARVSARNNIDRWLRAIDNGAEAVLFTASACLLEAREYPLLFDDNDEYQTKATRLSKHLLDFGEFISRQSLEKIKLTAATTVAFHAPCTMQHGLKSPSQIPELLTRLGYEVQIPNDAHLCCGSAGTYSILQSTLSRQLRDNKLSALRAGDPDVIVTANIGCMLHLTAASETPVKHWVELFD